MSAFDPQRDDLIGTHAAPRPPVRLMYWVRPGQLMAGCHPGHVDLVIAARQLGWLLDAGLRCFVDLMAEEPRFGFAPYEAMLRQLAIERGVSAEVLRFPIDDCSIPSLATMDAIQDEVDARLASGTPVYVHCWGGRGRTGLVVAGYLLRAGRATPADFREAIAALRERAPDESPETEEQAAFVRDWWRERVRGRGL